MYWRKFSIVLYKIIGAFIGIIIFLLIDLYTKSLFYTPDSVLNVGGAWGIQISRLISVFIGIVFLGVITLYFVKHEIGIVAFILLFSGVLGNIYDRVIFHGVRDWISIDAIIGFTFPLFNIADCCIVLGVIFLLGSIFLSNRKVCI